MPVKKASGTSETSIIIYQALRYLIHKDSYFEDMAFLLPWAPN